MDSYRISTEDRQDSQNLYHQSFFKLHVFSAQCIFGMEKYPDVGIILNYDDDYYSQGFLQNIVSSRALTKDDILQLYISDDDFRSSNAGVEIGLIFYVSDIQYQQNFTASQPIKVEFKFDGFVLMIQMGIFYY